jgi:YgiT-type zinc finger domain-containing protein
MEQGTAPFSIDRRGYHMQFDALPAWVCTQCGEPCFEEAEVARIQAILEAVDARLVPQPATPRTG